MIPVRSFRFVALAILVFAIAPAGAVGQESKYVLKGTIVTPDQVIEDGAVLIVGEKIKAVGHDVSIPADAKVVETGGIILPGFIDLHNHLTWNVFPRWRTYKEFANRYEWQQLPMYGIALSTPHAQLPQWGCAMNRFAEVKAITEGETSVVGSLANDNKCIEGLARNLDFYSGFYQPGELGKEKLKYDVFPLRLDPQSVVKTNEALDKTELTAFIVHIAEGKPTDAGSLGEFSGLVARGFLRSGVSIIHGVALGQNEFHLMAEKNVGLIWAPRSNLELYGATADVAAALKEQVKIALSPDWSATGSQGMLEELVFANTWNVGQAPPPFSKKELVRMATEYPAQLAGLSDKIGMLKPGLYADILVLQKKRADAYDSIVHSHPEDASLVVINGDPVYGKPELMKALLPSEKLETFPVCGVDRAIYFGSETKLQGAPAKTWKQTTAELSEGLRDWGSSLGPIADCPN
jgi:5-methylthioadenosine/S-adenosylhomocysteine deaminase